MINDTLDKCRTCKHYANTNDRMRSQGQKVIVGDFCLKFKWNLGRVKTWDQKLTDKKVINFPKMTKIPGDCHD